MLEFVEGADEGCRLDVSRMSLSERLHELALVDGEDREILLSSLTSVIGAFAGKLVKAFQLAVSTVLANNEALFYPSVDFKPNIVSTEVRGDVLYLKDWTVIPLYNVEFAENIKLSRMVYDFLSSEGYDLSSDRGSVFDLRISLENFEKMLLDADELEGTVASVRNELFA